MYFFQKISLPLSKIFCIVIVCVYSSYSSAILKIGFLSSCNIKCGIAAYTKHHIEAISRLGHQVVCYPSNQPLSLLAGRLQKDAIDILHIQYESGIYMHYPQAQFIDFMSNVKKHGIKIVMTIHREEEHTPALAEAADARIYHKPPYYACNKPHTYIIPHGVPLFTPSVSKNKLRKKYGFSRNDIILTTFGFLEPIKEYAATLKALVPFLKSNHNYRIQLLTSLNDSAIAIHKKEAAKITKVIAKYKLTKQVIHNTAFLPQTELSERLYLSDLGYLWRNNDTLAVSGAYRDYIAARLPLICPDNSHYYGSSAGVIKTPFNKQKFIAAIKSTLNDRPLLTSLQNQTEKYYREFNYDEIIKKHLQVYNNLLTNKPNTSDKINELPISLT